jgi:hypothetical protein
LWIQPIFSNSSIFLYKFIYNFVTALLLATGGSNSGLSVGWLGVASITGRAAAAIFTWSDGTPTNYRNFSTGQPSGDGKCVYLWGPGLRPDMSGGWNDFDCAVVPFRGAAICKKKQT